MFSITSKINNDFSIGNFYTGDSIVIHNWTNFINLNKYCRDNKLQFEYDTWIKSTPIAIETYKWIQEKYEIRPTFFSPHGLDVTSGIYLHPLLFQLFIADITHAEISGPLKFNHLKEFDLNELNRLVKNINKLLTQSLEEKIPKKSKSNDAELLEKKYFNNIKRQIKELKKNN